MHELLTPTPSNQKQTQNHNHNHNHTYNHNGPQMGSMLTFAKMKGV